MAQKFKLVRDTREKPDHGYSFDEDDFCSGTIVKALKTGDYSIEGLEDKLFIERKRNVAEVAANCVDPRFERELERTKEHQHKYIFLEFSMDDVLNYPIGSGIPRARWESLKISGNFILAYLMGVQIRHGIHVVFCGDRSNAQVALMYLLKKINKEWQKEKTSN